MKRKQLVRDIKRAALDRMEDAARTVEDFQAVVKQWNHLDDNRERKERDHEIKRNEETIRLGYSNGLIIPIPFLHPSWRQASIISNQPTFFTFCQTNKITQYCSCKNHFRPEIVKRIIL